MNQRMARWGREGVRDPSAWSIQSLNLKRLGMAYWPQSLILKRLGMAYWPQSLILKRLGMDMQ